MIKTGEPVTVIDVRQPEDFARSHIPGAINLPSESWEQATGLSKDNPNVVYGYSQTCHLAAKACAHFAGKGFRVLEMEGGFAAWEKHELSVEHEPLNRTKPSGERLYHPRR